MTISLLTPRAPSMELLSREPTSTLPGDPALMRGYAPPTLIEPCACGGSIESEPNGIADAVRIHNASTEHSTWAIANGWRHG